MNRSREEFLKKFGKSLEFREHISELEELLVLEPTEVMVLPRDSLPIEIMNAVYGLNFREPLFNNTPLSGECPGILLDEFGESHVIYYDDTEIFIAVV